VVPIEIPNEYAGLALTQRPVILKLRGAIDRGDSERDSYVVTEDLVVVSWAESGVRSLLRAGCAAAAARGLKHQEAEFELGEDDRAAGKEELPARPPAARRRPSPPVPRSRSAAADARAPAASPQADRRGSCCALGRTRAGRPQAPHELGDEATAVRRVVLPYGVSHETVPLRGGEPVPMPLMGDQQFDVGMLVHRMSP